MQPYPVVYDPEVAEEGTMARDLGQGVCVLAAIAAIVFLFTLLVVRDVAAALNHTLLIAGLVLYIGALWPLSVAIHELGHVLAGWMVGANLIAAQVCWWRFNPHGLDYRSGATPPRTSRSGHVFMVLRRGGWIQARHAWITIGGPLATLLAAVGFYWFSTLSEEFSFFLLIGAVVNGSTLYWAFRPVEEGERPNDGLMLRQYLARHGVGARHAAIDSILGVWYVGDRPSRWNPDSIRLATTPQLGDGQEATANLLAYYYFLSLGEKSKAEEHLGRALSLLESGVDCGDWCKHAALLEGAYFEALHRGNAARARELSGRASSPKDMSTRKMRATSAICLATGRPDLARRGAELGIYSLRNLGRPAMDCEEQEIEWFEEIRARATQ